VTNRNLDFHQIDALARQAVDLLLPEAELSIQETLRSNAYIYPQATGGDHGLWRITVTIAPGNSAVLSVDWAQSPADALADILAELSGAVHGTFRGRHFPECPGDDHPAEVSTEGGSVLLLCPRDGHQVGRLVPAVAQPLVL
jgi:hypothetical protein